MSKIVVAIAIALAGAGAAPAYTVLGFEGINPTYPAATSAQVLGFYGGGTSGAGTGGVDYGMAFSANAVAVCLNSMSVACSNASNAGLTPSSATGALGLASDGTAVLDLATAYTGAIGFRYAVHYPGGAYLGPIPAYIAAYDGVGGTGTLLITLALTGSAGSCPAFSAQLCPFGPGGLGFLTNVRSLVFGGQAGRVVWDDITFGAGNDPLPPPATPSVPSPAPEPASWATMLAGFALAGAGLRRSRRVAHA